MVSLEWGVDNGKHMYLYSHGAEMGGGGDSVGSAWNHISGHVFASFLLPRTGGRCESRSTTDG